MLTQKPDLPIRGEFNEAKCIAANKSLHPSISRAK